MHDPAHRFRRFPSLEAQDPGDGGFPRAAAPGPFGDAERTERFLVLYSACEARLSAYLLTLLGNAADAEEVFQETTLALWRSFDDFAPGTNFLVWAKRIAFYRVLTFRKQRQRYGAPGSEQFLRLVDQMLAERAESIDARLSHLTDCLARLSESDRRLISLRYDSDRTIKELAAELGRPANTLYKALERIRHALIECMRRNQAREERS